MSTTPAAGPRRAGDGAGDVPPPRAARRRPVRPLGDGVTERVRVIEFLWSDQAGLQPVLLLERTLLD